MSALFTISLQDLYDLTTHAATASSAAADDNKRREGEAWAKFDAIVERVKACPADITDQDFELTPEEQAKVDAAWETHKAALPAPTAFPWQEYEFFSEKRDIVAANESGGTTIARAIDGSTAKRIADRLNEATRLTRRAASV